jgi:pyruvate kinase
MNLEEIIRASDGAMVARGDMGTQVPLEQVPADDRVPSHPLGLKLLMFLKLSVRVRICSDAFWRVSYKWGGIRRRISMSSAASRVSLRIEKWWREEKKLNARHWVNLQNVSSSFSDRMSEEICNSATKMGGYLLLTLTCSAYRFTYSMGY